MPRYRLAILGIAAYLLFLLTLFPASTAWSWFSPKGSPLQLQGISGSVWQGDAAAASWRGQSIGTLHWDLKLLPLFLGKLGAGFSLQSAQGYLQGEARAPLGFGSVQLSGLKGQFPLAEIMPLMPRMPIPVGLAGTASLDISQLQVDLGTLAAHAEGRLNWHGAEVLSPQAFKMGNLQADLTTDDKGVLAAQLKDIGGPLKLDGQFQLRPDRSYSLSGTVAAADGAEASLQQALAWLGQADAGGKHRLNLNGRL